MIFSFFKNLNLRNKFLYRGIPGHILTLLTEDDLAVIMQLIIHDHYQRAPGLGEDDPLDSISNERKKILLNIFSLEIVPDYFKVGGGELRYNNWFKHYTRLGFTKDQATILSGVKWLKFDNFLKNLKKLLLSDGEQTEFSLQLMEDLKDQNSKNDKSTAPQYVRDMIKGALEELLEEENESKK